MEDLLSKDGIAYIISRLIDNARDAAAEDGSDDFSQGKRLAYYEMLDTIKNELSVREADLKEYGLDFDLELLL